MQCLRCKRELDPAFKACPHCGEPVTDFARRYTSELLDGKYRIVGRLGTGGMGEVYQAVHTFLDAVRVIKIVRPSIAGHDADDRFLREARLATRVHHPNVATLHDFAALPDGAHYMVWEYIDGENLGHVLRARGTLPPPEALDVATQALAGLEAIHRAGIVHRDISPENLMIARADGRVTIIDLGVAKMDEGDVALTKTGIFVGKLRYASPEHLGFLAEGQRLDGRADLYSLAIVLYEMLTGRPPFEATSPHQYLLHHSTAAETQAPNLSLVPADLRPVLARALERDREKRFATAKEFSDALQRGTSTKIDLDATMRVNPPPTAPPPAAPTIIDPIPMPAAAPPRKRSWIPIVAPLAILVVIVAMWMLRPQTTASQPLTQTTAVTATTTTSAATTTAPASQTTLDVTPPSTTTPPVTTTTGAPTPAPQPLAPQPAPATVHPEQPAAQVTAPAVHDSQPTTRYTEGGDGDDNAKAIDEARQALQGVTHVAVNGSGDPALVTQVAKSVRDAGLEIGDADGVVITFNGTLEHLGRGRKRRSAQAVITRHGRTVFRYEMPPEDYRIGDNPAEAFSRILREVLEH
jgi:serine/threonine-protein kinase